MKTAIKVTILTASKNVLEWKTLHDKLSSIEMLLNLGRNVDFTVDIKYKEAKPEINNKGRITTDWLNAHIKEEFDNGADIVPFHFTGSQKRRWRILKSLRGSNPRTNDEMGDLWFWADENTLRKGLNQFIETLIHEICHEYYAETGLPDVTHKYDEEYGTVKPLLSQLDWSLYQPRRMALKKQYSLLSLLLKYMQQLVEKKDDLRPRLPKQWNESISQGYGVPNSAYTLTGRHIGIDYACPLGTPIYAPKDGRVTVTGEHSSLGYFCYFEYIHEGKTRVERWLHLQKIPARGQYKQGQTIAHSGNTGFSTGPHFHVDAWWNDVNIGEINKLNWDELTFDPHIAY